MSDDLTTVHVGIGNSDDKIAQKQWPEFITDVRRLAYKYATRYLGEWFSNPAEAWQNCQMAWDMRVDELPALRQDLAVLRDRYGQDSIALCHGTTELI